MGCSEPGVSVAVAIHASRGPGRWAWVVGSLHAYEQTRYSHTSDGRVGRRDCFGSAVASAPSRHSGSYVLVFHLAHTVARFVDVLVSHWH